MWKPASLSAILLALPAAALADGCPQAPDTEAAMDALFDKLERVATEAGARILGNRLWDLWTVAPDAPSQAMLAEGMRARSANDYPRAMNRFEALVNYCPFYAEGYNQRAFVHFLTGNYEAALPDLDRALDLNPRHVGALSGKALTLRALGRDAEALIALDAALALNPWLGERHLRPALVQGAQDL
jgi:tetratricopeptide (TPR) repeat protein